jgi:monoamine oxidase
MQKNLLTLCEREMPTMVEISSEREPNGIKMMTVQTEITGSTVLCCTPPALTENIHLATLLRWTRLALRTP